jgi:hypothetical protein
MFTIDQNPIRLFFRSRLLLTTALISVASLNCLPSQAVAQVYLDNVNPGDGVIETESTGFFDTLRQSDAVWTDADGLNASALATDQTGILTAEDVDTPISLQIHNSGLTMGGLQVDSGHYSFSGGDLSAGLDTLTFYVAGNADPAQPDAQLNIDSDINAAGSTIRIENDLDGGLHATRNAGGDALGDAPHDEQTNHAHEDGEDHGVDVDDAEIDHILLSVTGGVPVRQMVDDVFAGGRRVCCCFVACCRHNQGFFQNAKKPACKTIANPISKLGQCISGYPLTAIASNPMVAPILRNSPMKKFAAYDAPERLFTITRRMAKRRLGSMQANAANPTETSPRVPTITPAPIAVITAAPN